MKRTVVLLQGPSSFFFGHLADALQQRGASVERVIVCPGDAIFWGRRASVAFRGKPENWSRFIRDLLVRITATDVIGLGDGRFWHSTTYREAHSLGIRVHVVEHGYLRPDTLTIEPNGTGGRSQFPRDPALIKTLGRKHEDGESHVLRSSFLAYAAMDVAYNLANVILGPILYPHYRTHALMHPAVEWAGWIAKALCWPARRLGARQAMARIPACGSPVFLFPLQLETDYQIRHHGPRDGLRATLRRILKSFIAYAPPGSCLIVKAHPLDNGLAPWRRIVGESATKAQNCKVLFLDGGDLESLFPRLSGVVTVNSTVGLSALRAGIPVIALGTAIYDLPGLTQQGGLDKFWLEPDAPDMVLVANFVNALKATIQVPGSFDGDGVSIGAAAIAAKIVASTDLGAILGELTLIDLEP